jgi:hypothetical protein
MHISKSLGEFERGNEMKGYECECRPEGGRNSEKKEEQSLGTPSLSES